MKTITNAVLITSGCMLLSAAFATPVTFNLTLIVTEVGNERTPGTPITDETFFPIPSIGDVFHGAFTLDDAILATDGLKGPVPMSDFHLDIAGVIWDPNVPSVLRGFRGPALGSVSPQFQVTDGQITALNGGPYGSADVPFVDFFTTNKWGSRDAGGISLNGDYNIAMVPEPATMASMLMGLGLMAGIGWIRRSRVQV